MTDQRFKVFSEKNGVFSRELYDPKFIITGDTDSSYIDLSTIFNQEADKNKVIEYSDKLGSDVNDSFPPFLECVFNIPGDRQSIVKTEREVVSDKSFFCAKKKYAMHVINEEGIEKDKLKIMGMEIKKSDTPIIIQDLLRDLVNMLMDDASYLEVEKYIEIFKSKFRTLSMDDIGWPKNIKKLTKYMNIYYGDGIQDMKGFPYHVRASMFYNSLATSSDIKIYDGSKIKITYIKHPDFKYIAIPTDANKIPDFVNEMEIDWDVMWDKVQKKLDIYLKPVGFDRDSRQATLINSLMEF